MTDQDKWQHPDWNTPQGQKLREQLERSARVQKEWSLLERKDARIAAAIVGAVVLFLLAPELLRWLHIPMPSWTFIPDWLWRYMP